MRQIATVMFIIVVCIFVCGLANSTSSNDPNIPNNLQGKWEYSTLTYEEMSGINKKDWICLPYGAIPDSIKKTVESGPTGLIIKINDFLNAFGNCGWELVTITEEKSRDISITNYILSGISDS